MIPKLIEKVNKANQGERVRHEAVVGNSVHVHVKVREGGKERIQIFSGTVIACHGGGAIGTFTVRRASHGIGVERVFPLNSPNIAKIEIERKGRVHRAKLYYLRDRTGRQSRLRESTQHKQQ